MSYILKVVPSTSRSIAVLHQTIWNLTLKFEPEQIHRMRPERIMGEMCTSGFCKKNSKIVFGNIALIA